MTIREDNDICAPVHRCDDLITDTPERGFEREVRKRLDYWARLRKGRGGGAA